MNDGQKTFTPRVFILLFLAVVVIPFLPLLISRRWGWWEAWVYAGIWIVGFACSRALAARRHPDLLAERARFLEHGNAKPWDRVLSPVVGIGGGLMPLVAGLDARFGSPPAFSVPVKLVSLGVLLAGYALASAALVENRFFSAMVRIQTDRGHHVVSSGPYRWVRHPGYAGALVSFWATPLFLDSLWALLPALLVTVALLIRTHLEDKTLRQELDGYGEYVRTVRYRLLPGVW
jgi:protein-S-isoprenylcysteine O-methyltransferase Ste14